MSEPIAEASVLIRPDTTKFRALLEAELVAATRAPVVVPVTPVVGGAGAVALASTTAGLQASGAAAQTESVALRKSAVAAREAATAHEQLGRGAGASVLSLLGIRAATLAASSSFLIGAAAITVASKSIKQFTDEQEAAARVNKILGAELGAGSVEWSRTLARSFGLADDEALRFEGAIAEVLHNVNVLPQQNQKLSQSLVELAADVAAFNNAATDDVLRAFQLGLSGNLRGLRQFVPGITAATVAQRALRDSGKDEVTQLTNQELVLARIAEIQDKAANQAGTFAERSGNLAAQSKILTAQLTDLGDELGGVLAPAFTDAAKTLNIFLGGVRELIAAAHSIPHGGLIKTILGDVAFGALAGPFTGVVGIGLQVKRVFDQVRGPSDELGDSLKLLPGLIGPVGGAFSALVGPIGSFGAAARAAAGDLSALQERMLDLVFTGASSAQRIANLQAQIRAQQAIIAAPGPGGVAARRRAKAERNQEKAEIDSIIAQDKADAASAAAAAKAVVSAAESAARELAAEKERADQAFLDALAGRRGAFDLRFALADATKSLADDIAAQRAFTALLTRQIAEIKRTALGEAAKAAALRELRVARQQSINATKELVRQQEEEKAARRKLIQDRADQRRDLDIEIAQAKQNVNAEIRAREARIRADREQLRSVHGDLVRRKQLQLEIAQDTQAIKDLKKQQDQKNNAAQALIFSFLQEQQGFAGRLLSNLLPTSAIRGTVGGGAAPPASVTGPAQPLAASAAVSAAGAGGATQGQMATLIDLMRQLVQIAAGNPKVPRHPEATYQTFTGSTEMAYQLG